MIEDKSVTHSLDRERSGLSAAAIELFSSNGFEQTAHEDIAEKAGLELQAISCQFPLKQNLASAIWHDHFEGCETYFAGSKLDASKTRDGCTSQGEH